jgi:hypothetical protein
VKVYDFDTYLSINKMAQKEFGLYSWRQNEKEPFYSCDTSLSLDKCIIWLRSDFMEKKIALGVDVKKIEAISVK